MRVSLLAGCSILALGCAYGQNAPSFEAASVKPAQPPSSTPGARDGCGGGPGTSDPGSWTCRYVNPVQLIRQAYSLQNYQFTPADWMWNANFDITAKVPAGTTKAQFLLMQQALLAERFKLVIHHEEKEMQVYELAVAKNGPKMKPTAEGAAVIANEPGTMPKISLGADKFPTFPAGRGGMIGLNGRYHWVASNVTAADIVKIASDQLNRPVTDATGLAGRYDVDMHWLGESINLSTTVNDSDLGASAPHFDGALQEQLGLKLNAKKGRGDIIVVDRLEKTPVAN